MCSLHGPPTATRANVVRRMRFTFVFVMTTLICWLVWVSFHYGLSEFSHLLSLMIIGVITLLGALWARLEDDIGKPLKEWRDPHTAAIILTLVLSLQLLWIYWFCYGFAIHIILFVLKN